MTNQLKDTLNKQRQDIAEKMVTLENIVRNLHRDENANWGNAGSMCHIDEVLTDLISGYGSKFKKA